MKKSECYYFKNRHGCGYRSECKTKYRYIHRKTYNKAKRSSCQNKSTMKPVVKIKSKTFVTYRDLIEAWLISAKLRTKESTYACYTHLVRTHISPYLGYYFISEITAPLVESFIQQQLISGRLDKKGGLSPKSVSDILTIIKNTIEYAKYAGVDIDCDLKRIMIKKKEKEMRVLTYDEQNSLLKVLLKNTDLYKLGVLISLYTGIRIGELCALNWEDICVSKGTLKIRKTMQRVQDTAADAISKTKVIITEPKSRCSMREIPLPSFLLNIIQRFSASPSAYVLTGEADKYIEPRRMQNYFKSYVSESGIDHANFHSLRHTFATRCIEVGFDLKSLSEILGHANVNITLNRYVHSSFDLKRYNMNKLTIDM